MSIETPQKIQELPLAVVKSMIALATSGFGVVVALAWNETIKKLVVSYIDPYLGKNSGLFSLLIYAVVMTFLAVIVTMQLTMLQKKLEDLQVNLDAKAAARKAKRDALRKGK